MHEEQSINRGQGVNVDDGQNIGEAAGAEQKPEGYQGARGKVIIIVFPYAPEDGFERVDRISDEMLV